MSARTYNINKAGRYSNVTVKKGTSNTVVVLHNTAVVIYDEMLKLITLNTNGWKTPTTKTCINNALRQLGVVASISQVKGQWYLCEGSKKRPFLDNMTLELT